MGWDQRLLENKDHSVRMLHGTCVQHHSEVARSANQDIYIQIIFSYFTTYILIYILKKICSFCKSILSFNTKLIIGQLILYMPLK